ncbi:MAG: hypothetical protein H0A76_00285 [Candidatus Thiodubiliella endoseptemdiera]|uniref:Uncharacterized protein n=1 Tax=Candidatus Thiodubiliella endoseptemdiera TaxID=2738886 RepID=A0A853F3S6_9GAMM|nr:hypothetical protein [Candidatus Thiodubiliella endoseptemdiera]
MKRRNALSGKVTGIGTLTITKIEFLEGSTVGTAITSRITSCCSWQHLDTRTFCYAI